MTHEEATRIAAEAVARCKNGQPSLATVAESAAIAGLEVAPVAKATRLQWGVLGALILGLGGFIAWALVTLGSVGQAQAQTQVQANSASDRVTVLYSRVGTFETRLESIDSGTRVAVENLRKEIADDRSNTARQLTDVQMTLQAVLREVKKK